MKLSMEQLRMFAELNEGDKVKLSSGETVEFIRAKQTKFIGIMNGSKYDIPMEMLVSIVEKVDLKQKKENNQNIINQLKKGEWFYINKNGEAIVFKFEKIENNKIIGINPICNSKTKIDVNFEVGLLK